MSGNAIPKGFRSLLVHGPSYNNTNLINAMNLRVLMHLFIYMSSLHVYITVVTKHDFLKEHYIPSHFMNAMEPELSTSLMGHLACKQT